MMARPAGPVVTAAVGTAAATPAIAAAGLFERSAFSHSRLHEHQLHHQQHHLTSAISHDGAAMMFMGSDTQPDMDSVGIPPNPRVGGGMVSGVSQSAGPRPLAHCIVADDVSASAPLVVPDLSIMKVGAVRIVGKLCIDNGEVGERI